MTLVMQPEDFVCVKCGCKDRPEYKFYYGNAYNIVHDHIVVTCPRCQYNLKTRCKDQP